MNRQHCTRITTRQSPPSAWPLKRADGTRFCDPASTASSHPVAIEGARGRGPTRLKARAEP